MEIPNNLQLSQLEHVGAGTLLTTRIHALLPYSPLMEPFSLDEVCTLCEFLEIYRAQAGQKVIREGEPGDYMFFVIDGQMEVWKNGTSITPSLIAVIGPGEMLGEMSLMDGCERAATCVATCATLLGVLTRDHFVHLLLEDPLMGSKLLIQLLGTVVRRLRATTSQLSVCLETGAAA